MPRMLRCAHKRRENVIDYKLVLLSQGLVLRRGGILYDMSGVLFVLVVYTVFPSILDLCISVVLNSHSLVNAHIK